MRDQDFGDWLARWYRTTDGVELDTGSQSTTRSNVARVESAIGDLDAAWSKDRGTEVLARLQYSKDDERRGRPSPHGIRIVGNTYNSLASLRRAAVIYFEFCAAWSGTAPSPSPSHRVSAAAPAALPVLESSAVEALARLLARRNEIDVEIARVIHRPALVGHLGEFIASKVFDIELEISAANEGYDGRFRSGPLRGETVDVKCYGKGERLLDMRPNALPDHFLVLTGPASPAASSVGGTRPFQIEEVFLFDAQRLVRALASADRPPKIGTATSVRRELWEAARVFPAPSPGCPIPVTPEQARLLRLFAGP